MLKIKSLNKYYENRFENLSSEDESYQGIIFENCEFISCNFQSSSFKSCNLLDCSFDKCNLSVVSLVNSLFNGISFIDSKLFGIKWYRISQTLGFQASFKNSNLDLCNFSDINLKNIVFEYCSLKEAYFNENNLISSSFAGSDLQDAVFHNCDLSKSNFRGAINYKIDIRSNKVEKAEFSLPEAVSLLDSLNIITAWTEN